MHLDQFALANVSRRRLVTAAAGSALAATATGGHPGGATARQAVSPDSAPLTASASAVFYRTVTIDGVQIFYREAGSPDAPTILLLHGLPSSSHMFRDLIPLLADRFHMVAPDYPGFGYSDAPSLGEFTYSFDHLADIVEGFIAAVGLDRYSLYVQDYGAPVGFRLASRRPERVKALVVQNGNAYEEGITEFAQILRTFGESPRSTAADTEVRAILTLESTISQYTTGVRDPERLSPDAWTLDQHFLDRPGNDEIQLTLFHDYLSNLKRYPEWHAYFREHQPPTLVTWGKNDPIFGAAGAEAFARDLPNAEIHLLDTGHFALEDHAGIIAGLMSEFLTTHVEAAR